MCIIITSDTPNHNLSLRELIQVFDNYPDGIGVVSPLGVFRTLYTDDDTILTVYNHISGQPFLLHGRQATHGTVTQDNIHPFHLSGGIYFAHNGMLSGKQWQHATKSDSRLLADKLARMQDTKRSSYLAGFKGQKFALWSDSGLYTQGLEWDEKTQCYLSNTYHRYGYGDVGGTASTADYGWGREPVYSWEEERDYLAFYPNAYKAFSESIRYT